MTKKKRKQKRETDKFDEEQCWDGQFTFIAGYTEGGAPYGITWEEADDEMKRDMTEVVLEDEDMPF